MTGTAVGDIDRSKLHEIKAREDAAFVAARPRSAERPTVSRARW
jgi:hypothetical protein